MKFAPCPRCSARGARDPDMLAFVRFATRSRQRTSTAARSGSGPEPPYLPRGGERRASAAGGWSPEPLPARWAEGPDFGGSSSQPVSVQRSSARCFGVSVAQRFLRRKAGHLPALILPSGPPLSTSSVSRLEGSPQRVPHTPR
jgi:hypothetical protein